LAEKDSISGSIYKNKSAELYLGFSGGIYTAPNCMLSGKNNWPLHGIQRIQEHGEFYKII
jgi:hypothetical protein